MLWCMVNDCLNDSALSFRHKGTLFPSFTTGDISSQFLFCQEKILACAPAHV